MGLDEDFEDGFYPGIVYGVVLTVVVSLALVLLIGHGYLRLSQGYTGLAEGALIVVVATWGSGALVSLSLRKGTRLGFIAGAVAGTFIVVIVAAIVLAILASASSEKENNAG
ncbi:MAG: hypothetical protein ACPLSM_07220 [Thermosphaera sp.]